MKNRVDLLKNDKMISDEKSDYAEEYRTSSEAIELLMDVIDMSDNQRLFLKMFFQHHEQVLADWMLHHEIPVIELPE